MTPLMLEEALITRLEELFEEEKYLDKNNNLQQIKVIQGVPVPKRAGLGAAKKLNVPFTSVRFLKGVDRENDVSKAFLTIDVMLFNETKEGHKELLNILEKIRQEIFKKPMLSKYFTLDFESEYKTWIVEEESYPYWLGIIECVWNYHRIADEGDLDLIT